MIYSRLRFCTQRLSCRARCDSIVFPCSNAAIISKRFQSTAQDKPYYVTTPIFYVNAAPHIGHLYTLVLSDVLKRWQVLRGKDAILCTGTDEHGMKIQRAAEAAEVDTKSFCDQNAAIFKHLAERANISHDHFIRTTDPDHRLAVQHFWMVLQERGFIYESKHEGWYSVSDETFYPESAIARALNPSTGKTFIASIETGKEVEWTSEINYHFKLSAFREPLLQFYKDHPNFIVPASRMQEVVRSVEEGLSDLSISRPRDRLSWGIPVPGDETQTIYVWLDALINYLTKAGYPFHQPGALGAWPADVQVIGKDITRFHCIYWPAFLMALNLPPPKQILTHAHWTLGKRKMAKSTGNVVNPFFAIDRFGIDAIRYYMVYDGGIQNDADYENSFVTTRYKKGLFAGIGNLASRVVRPPAWSVRRAVQQMTAQAKSASIDQLKKTQHKKFDALVKASEEHHLLLSEIPSRATQHFDKLNSSSALQAIMDVIFATNAYIQQQEPWNIVRTNPEEGHQIIFYCAESLRICGILLQPFVPDKMSHLLDMLGVSKDRRMFVDAKVGADEDYGTPLPGVKLGKGHDGSLFPPFTIEWDIDVKMEGS